jgi:Ca2+-binding EF-hand superfamily protein
VIAVKGVEWRCPKRKNTMSAKTLIIAAVALAASTTMTLPALAAGGDGTGPNGTGPGPNPPAAAQNVPFHGEIIFNLLDTNHDGAVDKDEYTVLSNAVFQSLDGDHDGKLTQEELSSRFGAMMAGRGGPGMQFNGRGHMDGRGWGQGRMDGRDGPGMMGRMGFNGPGPRGAQVFDKLDTNNDGAISMDEFAAHLPGQAPGQQQ